MQKAKIALRKVDNIGIIISSLCAVHCALTPLLLLSTTVVSINPELMETIEIPFLIVSVVVAFLSIINSINRHLNFIPMLLAIAGLGFVAIGGILENNETLLRVLGSLLIISGHIVNKRILNALNYEK